MGCCGSSTYTGSGAQASKTGGPPVVTGYAVDMPDGRTFTYLTRDEAEMVRGQWSVEGPVREVLGWR